MRTSPQTESNTFSSLYGFHFEYPISWVPKFETERICFIQTNETSFSVPLTISTVQSRSTTLADLTKQMSELLSAVEHSSLVNEQEIILNNTPAYSCNICYTPSGKSETEQVVTIAIPLLDGQLTVLMNFKTSVEQFDWFDKEYIRPLLDSFYIDDKFPLPSPGYRRIAKDNYGVAIEVPANWLITKFSSHQLAFRSLKQRWQIDNVVLKIVEDVEPFELHQGVVTSNFDLVPNISLLKEYPSVLAQTPAHTVEYIVFDRLGVLNWGKQTIAVSNNMLVQLTTLAPQDKLNQYTQTFDTIYQTFFLQS